MALNWEDMETMASHLDMERRSLVGAIEVRNVDSMVFTAARLEAVAVMLHQFAVVLARREGGAK